MIDKDFINKTALITGGSKGIGRSICEEFAKKGAEVIFTFRKNDKSVKSLISFSKKYNQKIYGYRTNSLSDKNLKVLLKKIKKDIKKLIS